VRILDQKRNVALAFAEERLSRSCGLFAELTPAERLVATHVIAGLSNKEIASVLGKAEPTIKHQIASLMAKAGAHSRTRFVALYYQQFFCPLPAPEP
jgi:DNA-binding NarL/FixJ family response regulator